jgi:hypothetical protein
LRSDGWRLFFSSDPHNQAISHNGKHIGPDDLSS